MGPARQARAKAEAAAPRAVRARRGRVFGTTPSLAFLPLQRSAHVPKRTSATPCRSPRRSTRAIPTFAGSSPRSACWRRTTSPVIPARASNSPAPPCNSSSIADRIARRIRGEPGILEDGGLAVEALDLIRQNGLVARSDFHDVINSDPIFASVREKLRARQTRRRSSKCPRRRAQASVGEPPETHLDGETLTPQQLAKAVLGQRQWSSST